MLLTLEGVDGGGKSTLAEELRARLDGRHDPVIWHEGPPPEGVDLVAHYERPLLLEVMLEVILSSRALVLDRWEVGELVYGPLLRGESRLSPGQALHVELVLRSLGAVRLLVQPDGVGEVLARYDARGDALVKREWLPEIHAFYEGYARAAGWWRPSEAYQVSTAVLHAAARTDVARRLHRRYPGYAGSWHPDVLLVGERRSNWPAVPPEDGAWGRAAFTPTGRGTCSQWLLDRLVEAGAWDVGLCNAHEPGQSLGELWWDLGQPRVVALGNAAARELHDQGIPHAFTRHPQWWKRFRARYPEEFASDLRRKIDDAPVPLRDRRRRVLGPAEAGPQPR